jgi:hypothetical protein
MSAAVDHHLVRRYLADLRVALASLPEAERADVADAVREHVEEALAGVDHPSDDDVRRVLRDLGDPLAIAASAGSAGDPVRPAPLAQSWVPPVVAFTLLLGALTFWLIYPVLLLIAGIVLLAASPLWTKAEKLWGASGAVLPIVAAVAGGRATSTQRGSCYQSSDMPEPVCTDGPESWWEAAGPWIVLGVPAVVVLIVTLTLWRRGERRVVG